ncbi:hypothetical protein Tco_0077355 [Tanacetum coccineum]
MIQLEPEGSTQGYPLDSVEVLRFDTLAGNPAKEIVLKLNLPNHRSILTDLKIEVKPRSSTLTEVSTADMIIITSMIELESLFDPLFDEYFNGENQVVSKFFTVTTADASDKRQQQPDSTSSTSTLATSVTVDGNFDL